MVAQVVLENVYKTFPRQQRELAPAEGIPYEEQAVPTRRAANQPAVAVLRRITLTVEAGEFMVLVGPSGCGKSTLLRLIAGLEPLTGGNIWVGDRLVNDLPPKQRDIAMVFQSYALYPHMTVYDNLAFGLRRMQQVQQPTDQGKGTESSDCGNQSSLWRDNFWEKFRVAATRWLPEGLRYLSETEKQIDQRVRTVAQMLQIELLLNRLPKQLSGGQKQRVALGRAMAREPQVFLMDEPLSNLDAKLRAETRAQIVNLQRQLGTTTIYVTHDQTEALTMGDRIAVMYRGQIQQIAPPLELYHHPVNRFVAEFIGSPPINFLRVRIKKTLVISHAQFRLTLPGIWEEVLSQYEGCLVTLGIRPEHLSLSLPAPKNLPVKVMRVEALGSETYLSVRMAGETLQARVDPDRFIQPGENLWLAIAPDKVHLFDAETGVAIQPSIS